MKKFLLLVIIVVTGFAVISQNRVIPSKKLRDIELIKKARLHYQTDPVKSTPMPSVNSSALVEKVTIGSTRYNLQTNTGCQNRFHVYDDGTMGATWTMGFSDPNFLDRGTGYNYFDGTSWSVSPETRIETIRAGWPSYSPYGENGEIVVSHDFTLGRLIIETRQQKGTGNWSESFLPGPGTQISWPRATTSGINHDAIQVLALTWPIANNGTPYQGLDGALLYSRTTDGGLNWDPLNAVIEGLDAEYYSGFSADIYEWAITGDDNIAFLLGDSWRDLILMKSGDGGNTWSKTIIWEHPYPLFNSTTPYETDTFYCADGAHHLAYDSEGLIHVVFGINRARCDGTNLNWYPFVDGVAYWNENRPTFSNHKNALSPYGDPGSEMTEDYNLIGWTQDVDGDGQIIFVGEETENIGTYFIGLSSMPQLVITEQDQLYVVYSSVTENYDNSSQNYRHLWARYSPNGEFWGKFVDLNTDLIHIIDECVFPSIASKADEYFYLIYQTDDLPGLNIRGDEDPCSNNTIWFLKEDLDEVFVGEKNNALPVYDYDVFQNYPNPASVSTVVKLNIRKVTGLVIEVVNMMGQTVITVDAGIVKPGTKEVELDVSPLKPGLYFYTVKTGEIEITRKMIVE